MIKFVINNELIETEVSSGVVLLDFIREIQKLPGTKEACREGECGACTVLVGKLNASGGVDYKACASCLLPIGDVDGCHVVTVEGVSSETQENLIQRLIVENSASQCGFCTPGIVLSLTGFCFSSSDFSYEDAVDALDGNICRCTGYEAIRRAAKDLSSALKGGGKKERLNFLIQKEVLPEYFSKIPARLKKIKSSLPQKIDKESVVVAGGTDLFVQKPDALEKSQLYFMSARDDLKYIKSDSSFLKIGGAVTLEEFRISKDVNKYFPFMKKDMLLHSSAVLRNKATLAGNIVNASPIADAAIMFLALNASLVIQNETGDKREVALSKFYKGYKIFDLKSGEIISEIKIPIDKDKFFYNFEKVSNRKILDIATVNTALFLKINSKGEIKEIRISAGGVAPVPLLIKGLEAFAGKKPDAQKIAEFSGKKVKPIDDVRGSADYKKTLLKQLIIAHFKVIGTVFPLPTFKKGIIKRPFFKRKSGKWEDRP